MVCLFKLDPLERALYLTLCYRCSIARIKERLENCEGAWQHYNTLGRFLTGSEGFLVTLRKRS